MAKGGFTGAVPPRETSPEKYSGVWDIVEQYGEQKAGNWPFQPADCAPRSLRFNSADSAHLSKTPAAAGNRKTWTWSGWVKRSALTASDYVHLFGYVASGATVYTNLIFKTGADSLQFWGNSGSVTLETSNLLRDPSAWYHLVLAVDTTQATAADRAKIYVNGSEAAYAVDNRSSTLSQNADLNVNNTVVHEIGGNPNYSATRYFNGCLAEINFIDGQALSPQEFGFFDGAGIWQPKRFTGDYSSGPVYSNGTLSASPAQGNIANLFDGNIHPQQSASGSSGNQFYIYNQSAITYTFPQPVSGTFKVYAGNGDWNGSSSNSGGTISLNTGASVTLPTPGTQFYYATVGVGTNVTSITFNPANGGILMGAIYVDDVQLVDAAVGRNSFHLDFSDASSNAALGTDSSGNGNNWSVNNLSADKPGVTTTGNISLGNINRSFYFKGTPGQSITVTTGNHIWDSSDGISWTYRGQSSTSVSLTAAYIFLSGKTGITFTNSASASVKYWDFAINTGIANGAGTTATFNLEAYGAENIDSLLDTPVNGNEASTGAGGERRGNYATLNPLNKHNSSDTFSNGNLDFTGSSGGGLTESTIAMSSGKYYFEAVFSGGQGTAQLAGIRKPGARNYNDSYIYVGTGNKYTNGASGTSYGESLSNGDTIGTAFDATNGTLTFYKNGVSQGTAFTSISGTYSFFVGSFGSPPTFVVNFGQRPFAYPLSGFSPLATSFLPEPTIKRGDEAMDVVLYEGNGTSQTIDNLRLSPGFVWIKNRDGGYNHVLFDVVRGTGGTKVLFSNRTTAEGGGTGEEGDTYGHVTSFNDDGFTVAKGTGNPLWVSNSGDSYVSSVWDAGDATTTIAAGSLNSSVYNQTQTWSGNITTTGNSGTFLSALPATNAFNNNDANYAHGNGDGSQTAVVTLTLSPGVSCSNTVTFLGGMTPNGTATISVNGGTAVSLTSGSSATTKTNVSFTGIVTSIVITKTSSDASGMLIYGFEIDGTRLVDPGVTVANVPSIATTVRARPDAGFSIVKYQGDGSTSGPTIAHSLGTKPAFVIIKNLDGSQSYPDWYVKHKDIGDNYNTRLNLYVGRELATGAGSWYQGGIGNLDSPNVISFLTGSQNSTDNVNKNGVNYIAYCWAEREGYSKMSSYVGSGNQQFVFLGFTPAWLMIKRYTDNTVGEWTIYDTARAPFNEVQKKLWANNASGEEDHPNNSIDIVSNGFVVDPGSDAPNVQYTNNGTVGYLYVAFASHPFASNARAR